jgi:hypothetical protein
MKKIGFHESTLVRFTRHDAIVELALEDVLVDGEKSNVTLVISQVTSVSIDGVQSSAPLMEASDGEVITLEISEGVVSLIVEWNDFARKNSFTRSYRVLGGDVSISVIN